MEEGKTMMMEMTEMTEKICLDHHQHLSLDHQHQHHQQKQQIQRLKKKPNLLYHQRTPWAPCPSKTSDQTWMLIIPTERTKPPKLMKSGPHPLRS